MSRESRSRSYLAKVAQAAANQGGAALRLARAARAVRIFRPRSILQSVIASDPADIDTVVEMGLLSRKPRPGRRRHRYVPGRSGDVQESIRGATGDLSVSIRCRPSPPARSITPTRLWPARSARRPAALVGAGVALDPLARLPRRRQLIAAPLRDRAGAISPARSDLALSLAMSGEFDRSDRRRSWFRSRVRRRRRRRLRQNLALI